jgi:hypothetical protein
MEEDGEEEGAKRIRELEMFTWRFFTLDKVGQMLRHPKHYSQTHTMPDLHLHKQFFSRRFDSSQLPRYMVRTLSICPIFLNSSVWANVNVRIQRPWKADWS